MVCFLSVFNCLFVPCIHFDIKDKKWSVYERGAAQVSCFFACVKNNVIFFNRAGTLNFDDLQGAIIFFETSSQAYEEGP